MRFFKNSIIFLIVFALILCITGCNKEVKNLKVNILKGFNNVIESFSQHALTKDSDLQGERITDEDSYTGTYKASYNHYNGKEYLFGGTSLQRDDGNNLKITYSLNISSGSGTLYWQEKDEKHIISDISSKNIYEFILSSGDNYIVFEGDDFTGNINIKIE